MLKHILHDSFRASFMMLNHILHDSFKVLLLHKKMDKGMIEAYILVQVYWRALNFSTQVIFCCLLGFVV